MFLPWSDRVLFLNYMISGILLLISCCEFMPSLYLLVSTPSMLSNSDKLRYRPVCADDAIKHQSSSDCVFLLHNVIYCDLTHYFIFWIALCEMCQGILMDIYTCRVYFCYVQRLYLVITDNDCAYLSLENQWRYHWSRMHKIYTSSGHYYCSHVLFSSYYIKYVDFELNGKAYHIPRELLAY